MDLVNSTVKISSSGITLILSFNLYFYRHQVSVAKAHFRLRFVMIKQDRDRGTKKKFYLKSIFLDLELPPMKLVKKAVESYGFFYLLFVSLLWLHKSQIVWDIFFPSRSLYRSPWPEITAYSILPLQFVIRYVAEYITFAQILSFLVLFSFSFSKQTRFKV